MSGDAGSPSSEFSVTASRLMQNVMGDDDIEYFASIADDPPYDTERIYAHGGVPVTAQSYARSGALFPDDLDWRDDDVIDDASVDGIEEARDAIRTVLRNPLSSRRAVLGDVQEVSGVAGIGGYTGPLGYAPRVPGRKKRARPRWAPTAMAFGCAKKKKIKMRTK